MNAADRTVQSELRSQSGRSPRLVRAPERRLKPSTLVSGVIAALLLSIVGYALITAPSMQWPVVGDYLFSRVVLNGVKLSIILTAVGMSIAVVLGTVVALMMMSSNPVFRLLASGFLWVFRGVPALVQLLFWYNIAILWPELELGVPFGGPTWFGVDTNSVTTPLLAAIIGLSLHEAAYMAEVVRSSIISVNPGQREAAKALGLTARQIFWQIVLPQAMRVMVPNTGNRTIGMLKFTSLASFLAVQELLYTVQSVYNRTLETIPLLTVATIWYLALVSILTWLQHRVEDHYGRDVNSVRLGPPAGAGGTA